MSGLYPCMHTSKEKVGITDYTLGLPNHTFVSFIRSETEAFVSSSKQKGEESNRVKSGLVHRLIRQEKEERWVTKGRRSGCVRM